MSVYIYNTEAKRVQVKHYSILSRPQVHITGVAMNYDFSNAEKNTCPGESLFCKEGVFIEG